MIAKIEFFQISTIKMHFNSDMELDLCFRLLNGSFM